MDLSPEVYMMSRDEMSSTSSSPEYHRVVWRLRGVLQACMYMSGIPGITTVASGLQTLDALHTQDGGDPKGVRVVHGTVLHEDRGHYDDITRSMTPRWDI